MLDSTEQCNINKTRLDYGAKSVMQPHFTPKWVGIFIYVLMVEAAETQACWKFIQDQPVSPSFDPLVFMLGSGGHFLIEQATIVTRTTGSPQDLSPPTNATIQLLEPARFSVERQLMTLCVGAPRKPFSLCLILGVHLNQEDNSSYAK